MNRHRKVSRRRSYLIRRLMSRPLQQVFRIDPGARRGARRCERPPVSRRAGGLVAYCGVAPGAGSGGVAGSVGGGVLVLCSRVLIRFAFFFFGVPSAFGFCRALSLGRDLCRQTLLSNSFDPSSQPHNRPTQHVAIKRRVSIVDVFPVLSKIVSLLQLPLSLNWAASRSASSHWLQTPTLFHHGEPLFISVRPFDLLPTRLPEGRLGCKNPRFPPTDGS